MMVFRVYRTDEFDKQLSKLSRSEQEDIHEFEKKLSINPYAGKPLGYRFLRENKLDGKRVYYLVYEDLIIILMVAISNKKEQKDRIRSIKENLEGYYDQIRDALKKY